MEERDLSMLTQEQLDKIEKLPEDMREGIRNLFIKQYEETQALIAAAKRATVTKSFTIEPHLYVKQVLENSPGLASKLELIALAVDYMLPGCLNTAKEKHSTMFDTYYGIAFMQVIAATEVSRWKSKRDIDDKMLNELRTLDPDYVTETQDNESEEQEEEDAVQETDGLPIPSPKEEPEKEKPEVEDKPPKTTKASKAA